MPHTTDKLHFAHCVDLLGGPQHLHAANRVNGRRVLDTAQPGQQCFQALLFGCFNSVHMQHPWDSPSGRSMHELHTYLGWISPQPDRLLIQCTVAARVASYLLPHSRIFADGAFEHAGIPGLRISGFKHRTITLVHVPTNGVLELIDCQPHTGKALRRDLGLELQRHHASHERNGGAVALWDEDQLDPIEEAVADSWRIRPATVLLSALMARNVLFWRRSEHATALCPPRRSNSAARVEWKRGYSGDEMGELLTGPAVGIPGAISAPAQTYVDPVMLRVGAAQIELEGPPAPRPHPRLRAGVRFEAPRTADAGTQS